MFSRDFLRRTIENTKISARNVSKVRDRRGE
jgi:hypothetical protein